MDDCHTRDAQLDLYRSFLEIPLSCLIISWERMEERNLVFNPRPLSRQSRKVLSKEFFKAVQYLIPNQLRKISISRIHSLRVQVPLRDRDTAILSALICRRGNRGKTPPPHRCLVIAFNSNAPTLQSLGAATTARSTE